MGKPKKNASEAAMYDLHVRLYPEQRVFLEKLCKADNAKKSEVVRAIFAEFEDIWNKYNEK